MRVAVVILNWNGRSFLEKFLPSVVAHSAEAMVYVADNASVDDSVAYVQTHWPNIRIIQNGANLGFAGGYNRALEGLSEEFFVLLNSDVEVTENWLSPLINLMDADPNIAACQPKLLDHGRRDHFEYAGAAGGFVDRLGYPFCRGRLFHSIEKDEGQYDSVKEVFWATGACMFVRSSHYRELGGLDADFFAHMEEIDLCWRAKRAGYRVMFQPASVVFHVGGGTLDRSNPHKTFLNFRNGMEMLIKNLPKRQLWYKVPLRLTLDGVAAIKFLLSGQPMDLWAVFRAHMSVYGRLNRTLSKRSGNYGLLSARYRGSILIEYFLKGKRKFSDLPSDRF